MPLTKSAIHKGIVKSSLPNDLIKNNKADSGENLLIKGAGPKRPLGKRVASAIYDLSP